jgi:hypothetical protein
MRSFKKVFVSCPAWLPSFPLGGHVVVKVRSCHVIQVPKSYLVYTCVCHASSGGPLFTESDSLSASFEGSVAGAFCEVGGDLVVVRVALGCGVFSEPSSTKLVTGAVVGEVADFVALVIID